MIPVGDDNSDRRTRPVITWALIGINILVFVFLQGLGTDQRLINSWSTVPREILTGRDVVTPDRIVTDPSTGQRYREPGLGVTPVPVFLTIFMAMFMHAGIAHILGNMLVPAVVAVGLWFVFQLISGLGYLGAGANDGVAYAAHIGGFAAGFITVKLWAAGRPGECRENRQRRDW